MGQRKVIRRDLVGFSCFLSLFPRKTYLPQMLTTLLLQQNDRRLRRQLDPRFPPVGRMSATDGSGR